MLGHGAPTPQPPHHRLPIVYTPHSLTSVSYSLKYSGRGRMEGCQVGAVGGGDTSQ